MRTRFRPDIEGLRAVAVLLPVITHVFGVLPGGVLGVDVFFVLSGFLITGLLLHDVERNGRVRLGAFVVRRIRRLAPLSVTVVVVTVVVLAPIVLSSARAALFQNALAALTGVENWHLQRSFTNYQAAGDGASPLQHYWSLAVEEQFYLVLPLVVAGCAVVARLFRRPRAAATLVAIAISGAVLLSVVYCLWRVQVNPAALYVDTFGRVWELGAGALAALIAPRVANVPRPVANGAFVFGLAAVVGSAFLVSDERLVPWPGAVPAVVGVLCIVLLGHRASVGVGFVLTNVVSRFVGRISFALYLWHFPVVVGVRIVWGAGPVQAWAALAVAVLLAVASHRWIEVPVRRSRWLSSIEHGGSAARRTAARIASPVLAGAVLLSIASQYSVPVVRDELALAQRLAPSAEQSIGERFEPGTLDAALREHGAEAFDPGAIDAATIVRSRTELRGCFTSPELGIAPKVCSDGASGASRHALIIGDSTAAAWSDNVRAALPRDEWRLSVISNSACPVVDVAADVWSGSPEKRIACDDRRARTIAEVADLAPDLVIVSTQENAMDDLSSGATGAQAAAEWREGAERLLEGLAGRTGSVVFLTPPPTAADPAACATLITGLAGCSPTIRQTAELRVAAEQEAAAVARESGADVRVIDTLDWFCDADGRCPAVIDGTVVRMDATHIAHGMAMRLVDLVADELNGGRAGRS
ncbi:acyltransferase family protein [Curtobacterium sp. A7_M15]|uniref:acyltransferase family protein n=1 Tax=Curtobacterium sp. A7_M15 TaxID=3065241 RepID=UPI002737D9E6|nr:acyltransferase family protein [Curtobacterium sp. A7_M15]MDP4332878.1 acyltransferase family protein [Curtobacterium sp. A7_M15]